MEEGITIEKELGVSVREKRSDGRNHPEKWRQKRRPLATRVGVVNSLMSYESHKEKAGSHPWGD